MEELLATLNSEQRSTTEQGNIQSLIFAGVGSGKARVSTPPFAHLIRVRNVEPRRIVAVTFTPESRTKALFRAA